MNLSFWQESWFLIHPNAGLNDYAHVITTGTPGFSDLPTTLQTKLAKDLQKQIEYLHTYPFEAKYRSQIEKEGVIHLLELKCIKSTPVIW